jgi:hypothetical protein
MVTFPRQRKSSQKPARIGQPLSLSKDGYYHSVSPSIQLWLSPVKTAATRRRLRDKRPQVPRCPLIGNLETTRFLGTDKTLSGAGTFGLCQCPWSLAIIELA